MAANYALPIATRLNEAIKELDNAEQLDLLDKIPEWNRHELFDAATENLESDSETTEAIAELDAAARILAAQTRLESRHIRRLFFMMCLTVYLPALFIFLFVVDRLEGSNAEQIFAAVAAILLSVIAATLSNTYCHWQVNRTALTAVSQFEPSFLAYIVTLLTGAFVSNIRMRQVWAADEGLLLFTGIIIWTALLTTTIARARSLRQAATLVSSKTILSQEAVLELSQTVQDLVLGVVQRTIRQLEAKYNAGQQTRWQTTLPNYKIERPGRNLVERYDLFFASSAYERLRRYLIEHDKGSIGLAGERGIGKTSLMAALRKALDEDTSGKYLTTWISSPTAFDEKEFLLSVLAQLATAAGAKLTGNKSWPRRNSTDDLAKDDRIRKNNVILLIWTTSVITFSFVHFMLFGEATYQVLGYDCDWKSVLILLFLPGVWLFVRLLAAVGPRHLDGSASEWRPHVAASSDLLEELWYERRELQSANLSFSFFGAVVRGRRGTERTREPFTLPHLVQMWDNFMLHISGPSSPFEKVIVFVDELDKIPEVERIGKFLLVLKTLYSPANVFFVISISDDAYEVFQTRRFLHRRRNQFDSSVGHVEKLRNMKHEEVYGLLEARIIGPMLPYPATLLIWMLSEGNPRDAVRIARSMLTEIINSEEGVSLWRISRTLWSERYGEGFNDPQWLIFNQGDPEVLKVIRCVNDSFEPQKVSSLFRSAIVDVQQAIKGNGDIENDGENKENRTEAWQHLLVKLWLALIIFELFCAKKWEDIPEEQIALLKMLVCDSRMGLVDEAMIHQSNASPMHAAEKLRSLHSLIDKS